LARKQKSLATSAEVPKFAHPFLITNEWWEGISLHFFENIKPAHPFFCIPERVITPGWRRVNVNRDQSLACGITLFLGTNANLWIVRNEDMISSVMSRSLGSDQTPQVFPFTHPRNRFQSNKHSTETELSFSWNVWHFLDLIKSSERCKRLVG